MLVAVGGAIAVLLSALLPWSRSGTVSRDAFELARVADELGELDGGVGRLVLLGWYAIPVLVAVAWLAATFVRPVLVATLAGTVALLAVVAGAAVLASALRTGPGPTAALGAGAATLAAAARLAIRSRPR
jgi:uncharacterized membrane protein